MKKLAITLLAVVGLATTFTACKKEDNAAGDMMQDQAFVTAASSNNLFGMAAANIALSKTTNTNIVAFANLVLKDNGQNATELQILARQKQLDIVETMTQSNQDKLTTLNAQPDSTFVREFATLMTTSQQGAVNLYTSASQSGVKDEGLKAFAAGKLPMLKQHLEAAAALKTQTGGQ